MYQPSKKKTAIEHKITSLINRKNDSRISILDGDWGVGKTFFVKNTLKGHLSRNDARTVVYVSLLDIDSTKSFESKILFAIMRTKADKSQRFYEASKSVKKIISGVPDLATKTLSAFNKNAGIAFASSLDLTNHVLSFKHIKNVTLIIDDLDRIDEGLYPKLQLAITTKSLSMIENNENVRILFVANMKKVNFNEDQKEKFFLPSIKFNLSLDEVTSIMRGYMEDRCESRLMRCYGVEHVLKKIKEIGNFGNLRVLKDCVITMDKFLISFQSILNEYDYDEVESIPHISEAFLSLYYSHLSFGASESEIKEAMDETYLNILSQEKYENRIMQSREREVRCSLTHTSATEILPDKNLFDFCFKGSDFDFSKFPSYLSAKGSFPSLSYFHKWPETMTDQECDDVISRVENYIFNRRQAHKHPYNIYLWARTAEDYISMAALSILPKSGVESEIIQIIPSIPFNMDGVKLDAFDDEDKKGSKIKSALRERVKLHFEEVGDQFLNLIIKIHSDVDFTPPAHLDKKSLNIDVAEILLKTDVKKMVREFNTDQLVKLTSIVMQAVRVTYPSSKSKDALISFLEDLPERGKNILCSIAIYNLINILKDLPSTESESYIN